MVNNSHVFKLIKRMFARLNREHPHFFGQMDYPDRSEAWMLSVEPGEHPLYELENVRIIHQKGAGDRAEIIKKSL